MADLIMEAMVAVGGAEEVAEMRCAPRGAGRVDADGKRSIWDSN